MDPMGLKGSLHVVFSPSNVRILATGKYFQIFGNHHCWFLCACVPLSPNDHFPNQPSRHIKIHQANKLSIHRDHPRPTFKKA